MLKKIVNSKLYNKKSNNDAKKIVNSKLYIKKSNNYAKK